MRLRDVVSLLGVRPRPKRYGMEVAVHRLSREGDVKMAHWLHPREARRSLDQSTVDELRRYITPGSVAIDIGAHTGDTAVPMALAAGPGGSVVALEPNPYVFPVLEETASLNPGIARIVPLMFAATPESGDVEFEYSDAGFCNGGRHEGISRWRHGHAFKLTVRGENLHAYLTEHHPELLPRVTFLKVDAEGYDLQVLRSLVPIIEQARPTIKAEMYKLLDLPQRRALFDFLFAAGYSLFRVEGDACLKGMPLDREGLMEPRHYDLLAVPT